MATEGEIVAFVGLVDLLLATPPEGTDVPTHLIDEYSRRVGYAGPPDESYPSTEVSSLKVGTLAADPNDRHDARLRMLFDEAFYVSQYPDIEEANIDPFEHYMIQGHKECRKPNCIFDAEYYANIRRHTDCENLLEDYALHGEPNGIWPCEFFDPQWYASFYCLPISCSPLGHYIVNQRGPFSPCQYFDADYYLRSYPDIAEAKINPFHHYFNHGYIEGRNPSGAFDNNYYRRRYLPDDDSINPLLHFIRNKDRGNSTRADDDESTIHSQMKRFTKPSERFEEFKPLPPSVPKKAKILAYFLTQYHAFTENDRWWGNGFTEWTNIAKGVPRFKGHYQPRIPRDLGFYNLLNKEVLQKQIDMARGGGVFGFVYYYYWFNGTRLMERPLDLFLQNSDLDMPFCLMWANENWTRRWDGLEGEILIKQEYSQSDDSDLIADFVRHFRDQRYIRLDGRPLLMIYRPGIIPSAKLTIERWRGIFRREWDENPIIIMSQSFDDYDPSVFGLDGAIEFPPHKLTRNIRSLDNFKDVSDFAFKAQVYDYRAVVNASLSEGVPDFPLIKTIIPSWDNDARRQGAGLVVHGSTPEIYGEWLTGLIERARSNKFFGESFVCVNAWNEWCEGAYLEPDLHFGAAYLNATANAISGKCLIRNAFKVVLLGHDAFKSGAQLLLLNIGRTLKQQYGIEIEFLLLGGGELESDYRQLAPSSVVGNNEKAKAKLLDLRSRGFYSVLANTSATGFVVQESVRLNLRTIFLVHELPRLLREKGLVPFAHHGVRAADLTIFPNEHVQKSVLEAIDVTPNSRFLIRPQGVYHKMRRNEKAGNSIRAMLNVGLNQRLVLGAGYADMRKGFDLFLQLWRMLRASDYPVHFCWIGRIDTAMRDWLGQEIKDAEATGTFHMPGFRHDAEAFFNAADAFALTSREDPFPSVALEAMSLGMPIVAFDNSGGIADFFNKHDIGHAVRYGDIVAMATALAKIMNGPSDTTRLLRAQAIIEQQLSFPTYVKDLVCYSLPDLKRLSVVVPNFNYARFLPERLATVFTQIYPTSEVIVLDDASSDSSIDAIVATASEHEREIDLVINKYNSGSVFRQWLQGAERAEGEFLWIAEADDLSEPTFLARIMEAMSADPSIVIGFADSRSIDAGGNAVYPDYKGYYSTVEPGALSQDAVFDGQEFVRRFLSVKNLILNVSAVVWRRASLIAALSQCSDVFGFRMAGDWRLYVECLMTPGTRIAYVADPVNVHRRHSDSVTSLLQPDKHIEEIKAIHKMTLKLVSNTAQQCLYISQIEAEFRQRSKIVG